MIMFIFYFFIFFYKNKGEKRIKESQLDVLLKQISVSPVFSQTKVGHFDTRHDAVAVVVVGSDEEVLGVDVWAAVSVAVCVSF